MTYSLNLWREKHPLEAAQEAVSSDLNDSHCPTSQPNDRSSRQLQDANRSYNRPIERLTRANWRNARVKKSESNSINAVEQHGLAKAQIRVN